MMNSGLNSAINSSSERRGQSPLPALDSTLELLRQAEPRSGLEQRVLARLASAPEPSWYHHFATVQWRSQWMLVAASGVIVASSVAFGIVHHRGEAPSPSPSVSTAGTPRPRSTDAVTPAASVAVPDHPLQPSTLAARHRGVHRTFRAQHPRTVLPPGTVAPSHPLLLNPPQ